MMSDGNEGLMLFNVGSQVRLSELRTKGGPWGALFQSVCKKARGRRELAKTKKSLPVETLDGPPCWLEMATRIKQPT